MPTKKHATPQVEEVEMEVDSDVDEDEEFDENLIPEIEDEDLTLDDVNAFVKAYGLAEKWTGRTNWVFYSGDEGSRNIKGFQAANEDMEGGAPVLFDDVFSKSFQNHVSADVSDENQWKVDAMLSYHFGLLAHGTVHVLLPNAADILKPYGPNKKGHWYLFELPAILRKKGTVTKIERYDSSNTNFDELGVVAWNRKSDHEGPLEPPLFEEKP